MVGAAKRYQSATGKAALGQVAPAFIQQAGGTDTGNIKAKAQVMPQGILRVQVQGERRAALTL